MRVEDPLPIVILANKVKRTAHHYTTVPLTAVCCTEPKVSVTLSRLQLYSFSSHIPIPYSNISIMEHGSNSNRPRPGPWPPRIEPFVPVSNNFNPRDLRSWATRTGFNPNVSGESVVRRPHAGDDLEMGAAEEKKKGEIELEISKGVISDREKSAGLNLNGSASGNNSSSNDDDNNNASVAPVKLNEGFDNEKESERDVDFESFSGLIEPDNPSPYKSSLICGINDNPGYGHLLFYGMQHYLSLAGSLIFIPIIMVPVMGGTDEETATVISTMLLVSGITTLMHTWFGTRLPLVQGASFVYLAPALVIINSEEFRNLSDNKFKHIMRELQGAIIVGSFLQSLLGYSGLMSLLLRLINPVVVTPTIAAVGLAFFSYGFPQAGACAEISIPLILLVLVCSLYLRKIAIFGHHIFLTYAVPLSVTLVWAYAFFLTAGGAFDYKGCSPNIPSSNILLDDCRRHVLTMKHCRTDVSNAWNTAAWVRIPYPLQWDLPTFHFKTSIIMIVASLVASVDSVGSYHITSILMNMTPPTPGIVSRGIGLEGVSSMLAGLWGTGTGSTTLTENVHTISGTKVANRTALQLGAAILILFSFLGKVGALLASIPTSLAAAVLCFSWAIVVALGLSTMQYTQSASARNVIIVGFTLFISLSIPAYFQQYQAISSLMLPGYLLPYAAGSAGPIDIGSQGLNYALNSLLSMNMVVAFLVAFVLDNTVPGSKEERGIYVWSNASNINMDSNALDNYRLPHRIAGFFKWVKWVGS